MAKGTADHRKAGSATAEAAANIAFIKYWGAVDLEAAIPANPSISMTLSSCVSRCSCRPLVGVSEDEILFRDESGSLNPAVAAFAGRVRGHLDRLRARMGYEGYFRIATENSFPAGAGMASSASGFCALALAVSASVEGGAPDPEELSIRARISGSGSATRSAMGGYVVWPSEPSGEGPAKIRFPASHWDLRDLVAVVQTEEKKVSSLDGHKLAPTSPHYRRRLEVLPERMERVVRALSERDFATFADVLEEEAIDLHLIAMSSRPAVFYWKPATLAVLEQVRRMRSDGLEAASTMDAGANVHVLCTPESEPAVAERLAKIPGVGRVIADRVGSGPRLLDSEVN